MINYKYDFLTLVNDKSVTSECGDISFYNSGGTPVTINNSITLFTGQTLVLSANENEIDKTIYYFKFLPTGNPTDQNRLIVIRKIYV
jgi:hypothetical protein